MASRVPPGAHRHGKDIVITCEVVTLEPFPRRCRRARPGLARNVQRPSALSWSRGCQSGCGKESAVVKKGASLILRNLSFAPSNSDIRMRFAPCVADFQPFWSLALRGTVSRRRRTVMKPRVGTILRIGDDEEHQRRRRCVKEVRDAPIVQTTSIFTPCLPARSPWAVSSMN